MDDKQYRLLENVFFTFVLTNLVSENIVLNYLSVNFHIFTLKKAIAAQYCICA